MTLIQVQKDQRLAMKEAFVADALPSVGALGGGKRDGARDDLRRIHHCSKRGERLHPCLRETSPRKPMKGRVASDREPDLRLSRGR